MIKILLQSLRLAFALVCVGVGLILTGQWLGVVPDARLVEMDGRKRQCEAIAVNTATMVREQSWPALEASLKAIAKRDDALVSLGIRTDSGYLRLQTDQHDPAWQLAKSDHSVTPEFPTGLDAVEVPITVNQRRWGQVELCYRALSPPGVASLWSHPVVRLVGFFALAGMGAYTFFAARIFGLFDNTQVVPDRVRQALDTLAEGLLVLNEKEQILLANKAFCENTMLANDELQDRRVGELPWVDKERRDPSEYPWARALAQSKPQSEELLRFRLADGNLRIFSANSAPIVAGDGSNRGTLATFRDVTQIEEQRAEMVQMLSVLQSSRDEIKQKNKELELLATQDSLTGCLNRRAFFERLAHHWAVAHKQRLPLSCIMIDNDFFKNVNDTYGHHAGDELLRAVSALLREMHQDTDLVCRYGGEEFCVVLPGRDIRQAERQAEQIRLRIEAIRLSEYQELRTTASLGVTDLSHEPSDPQDLINQADRCLYVAKRQGRNRVIVYLPQFAAMDVDESQVSRTREEDVDATVSIPFQAVMALVSALAFRDAETAEHSRRVADLAVTAAAGLLDQRQTYLLEIAALLHDIGKIGVPDNVLLKPGKLTEEEWKLMGKHDRIGVEIVAGTFNCDPLSEIIRTHHAFFGGRGRASGLPTGQDIPLAARLLTICDSYDAIVSDRPYRKGRSHEVAVEELRRCAGTQFDPEIVEHFVDAIENKPRHSAATGLSVPKHTALQLGLQIERLAEALDERDADGLHALASRVAQVARRSGVEPIAVAAERLEAEAGSDDSDWMHLLGSTVELLDLCRSTQTVFLADKTTV
ncbi:sensor domain-containing diguanylate cyclase/phosphohydrolase [Roseimaritima sediminicola]|uniref:sensor domain-containing diguanylate cyclase/phosphohydrolase n=1 Tax=Roseimaritima sediminicola TaxID=2662066 RepID=UPI001EED7450|nr:diguanylate cyclase [Roseimaritima sediminicola]